MVRRSTLASVKKVANKITSFASATKHHGVHAAFLTEIEPHLIPLHRKNIYYARKHTFITNYLKRKYQGVIDEFETRPELDSIDEKPRQQQSNTIWIFWWQGENDMPPIVRACYYSVRLNAGDNVNVILISRDNYRQYVDIPNYILLKVQRGWISLTQFSDIIRVSLLYEHGGLWLDSTIFVSKRIPKAAFMKFFTIKHPAGAEFAAGGRWTGFLLGGAKGSLFYEFLRACFLAYWKNENRLLDYFILDYWINLAYISFPVARLLIDSVEKIEGSDRLYELRANLDNAFDHNVFEKIASGAVFHKLSWKANFCLRTDGDEDTFYGFLLRNYADRPSDDAAPGQ